VVAPGTASDAYWMLRQAIACDDPVIFLEPKRRYWAKEELSASAAADFDSALIRRPGTDVTLIGYGAMIGTLLEAADAAAAEGISAEVIDLRSLSPFDDQTVAGSVRRTGRAIVVHEASGFAGFGAEVVARLTEQCFHQLHAPIGRVTGFDIPYPPPMLEAHHLPSVDRILDAIDRLQFDDQVALPADSSAAGS
jgi:pyruvate dehydrogenase E1 component beta subunit